MAPVEKGKRKQPSAGETVAPQKRQKLANAKATPKKRKVVNIDALSWKQVDIPEMFDDAEGFYNLESIEGIDIVKDGDKVEFHAVDEDSEAAKESAAFEEEEEFEGFSDDDNAASAPKAPSKSATDETAATSDKPEPADKKSPKANKDAAADEDAKPKTKKELKLEKRKQAQEKRKQEQKKKAQETVEDNELQSEGFAGLDALEEQEEELDMSAWSGLNLSPSILSSIARLKFSKPTAIQAAAIPQVLAGHDVIGKASTGSGKTLAFGIPIVERWLELQSEQEGKEKAPDSEDKAPLALVISPTRELAHQLTNHIKAVCEGLTIAPYVCSVTGGLSVFKQQRQLARADIVVGTPGRLWEVLSSSTALTASFKQIQYLVVDEADRILSEGHFKEAEEILKSLDRYVIEEDDEGDEPKLSPRQTLVFSATFARGLQQKLAGKGKAGLMSDEESMEYLLKKVNFREENPQFVDVNPVSQMAKGLKEGIIECSAMEKDLYLYAVLLLNPNRRSLVFTNSIQTARRLAPMLQNLNLNALPLHSQMAQKARLRSVEKFTAAKPGTAATLIATDVAARGLDIKGIEQVIHYHVPRAADMYVHRSGRTARAETQGISILLCAPEEVVSTRRLAAKVHHKHAAESKFFIRSIDINRKLVSRLKPRMDLAKKLADAVLAKEKGSKEDDWMKQAAEDLGVEYDSEELEKSGNWGGRGSQRKKKQQEARQITKAEMGAMRAQLRELLSKRVNTGVSEKYITGGRVDVDELLRGGSGEFLGKVDGLDLDD